MSDLNDSDEPVGSTYVFARVASRLDPDETARSLWLKLEQEIKAGGVLSATSYLGARFKELSDRFKTALTRGG
jgi:hypothetical protein